MKTILAIIFILVPASAFALGGSFDIDQPPEIDPPFCKSIWNIPEDCATVEPEHQELCEDGKAAMQLCSEQTNRTDCKAADSLCIWCDREYENCVE